MRANGIDICYETFGSEDADPLLLIMGFTAQMISWDEGFCEMLASRGFHVIRFDNRDVGLSSKTPGDPPTLRAATAPGSILEPGAPPYTLTDMASDAVGVLDGLGIGRAHTVGASMGGMIAQRVALHHPERVLSLTSIMSTTGAPGVGEPSPEALGALMTPPPAERDAYLDHSVSTGRVISGPLFDPERARARAARAYDRCFHPVGAAFQLAAILADGDRTEELATIEVPTLVIHGRQDTLISPSGGEATARAIAGSRLVVLEEMGHDLPEPLWPEICDAIEQVASRAQVA